MTRLALALAAALLLAGCADAPFPAHERDTSEPLRSELAAALVHPIGASKMLQRVVLEVGGEESNLTLYVQVRPPDAVHLVALSDLGGTVFDAKGDGDGVQVVRASPWLPERLVRRLVLDERLAFLAPQAGPLALVRLAGGEAALHGAPRTGGEILVRRRGAAGGEIDGGEDGRLLSIVRIEAWARGGGVTHPARLALEGVAERYRASVEVLRFEPLGEAAPSRAEGR